MKYVLVAEVPEDLNITDVDGEGNFVIGDDVIQTLTDIGAVWPSSPAINSITVGVRKIIYLVVIMPSTDPILALETVIEMYALDWQLLAGQTFNAQAVTVDDVTTYAPIKIMEPNEARLFEFIPDRYTDEEQTIIDPNKHINWVSTYSGQDAWQAA